MFATWFGTRTPRPAQQNFWVRPQLERLEDRLPPSSMGMGSDDPVGDDHGGDDNREGPHEVEVRHINDFDDFDLEDNDTIPVVMNNLNVNHFFEMAGAPQNQLVQALVVSLGQALMTTPQATTQDAISLLTNEFQLAKDTGILVSSVLSGAGANQTVLQDIHNVQVAIQSNPLEATTAGQVAGVLAFDLALNATLSGQFGGQGHS
jgi:hypothetical protein